MTNSAELYLGDILISQSGGGGGAPISVTHAELSEIAWNGQLTPGQSYRITDYVATVDPINTYDLESANHPFDVIVEAENEWALRENAKAIWHDENDDDYFFEQGCRLTNWELKYSLENNTDKWPWCDGKGGKGVIYWLKDEFGNEVGFDFKGIKHHVYSDNYEGMFNIDWDNIDFDNLTTTYNPQQIWAIETFGMNDVLSSEAKQMLTDNGIWLYFLSAIDSDGEVYDASVLVNRDPNFLVFNNVDNDNFNWCTNHIICCVGDDVYMNTFENRFEGSSYNIASTNNGTTICYNVFKNVSYSNLICQASYNNFNSSNSNVVGEGGEYNIFDSASNNFMLYGNNNRFLSSFGNCLDAECNFNTFEYSEANYLCSMSEFNKFYYSHENLLNKGVYLFDDDFKRLVCSGNTFDRSNENVLGKHCCNNTFKNGSFQNNLYKLVGLGHDYEIISGECFGNIFESSQNNILLSLCSDNTFSNNCQNNILDSGCTNNFFGDNCSFNVLCSESKSNRFGNNCEQNYLGGTEPNDDVIVPPGKDKDTVSGYCEGNIFENDCIGNRLFIGCGHNKFQSGCSGNTLGDPINLPQEDPYTNCIENIFGIGCSGNTICGLSASNIFSNDCLENVIMYESIGNTFGTGCSGNTLGYQCSGNTFGSYCCGNVLGDASGGECDSECCELLDDGYGPSIEDFFPGLCIGNDFNNYCNKNVVLCACSGNTFGTYCELNVLSFNCNGNSFGNYASQNQLGTSGHVGPCDCDCNIADDVLRNGEYEGGNCSGNTFGNYCRENAIGDYSNFNKFGDGCINIIFGNGNLLGRELLPNYWFNVIEAGAYEICLNCTNQDIFSGSQYQNVRVCSGVHEKIITDNNVNQTMQTIYTMNSNGDVVAINLADLLH